MTERVGLAGLLFVVLVACEARQQELDPPAAAIPDSVAAELVELGNQDQALRQNLTPEKMQDSVFGRELLRGDSARTRRLREIVEHYGWPDWTRVSPQAADAAFLILQHSPDHQFQRDMAPHLEALARSDRAARADVAMLVDRVLMHGGLPQRYGTQFTLQDSRWVLHPVENEAELESRRHSMQLPPMEAYMKMMEELYRAPVVR